MNQKLPPIKPNRGITVKMTVGDVFFTTERAFVKWWNAQTEEVKSNLRLSLHPQIETGSTTATANTTNDQD